MGKKLRKNNELKGLPASVKYRKGHGRKKEKGQRLITQLDEIKEDKNEGREQRQERQ